jgi:hypothetical protein
MHFRAVFRVGWSRQVIQTLSAQRCAGSIANLMRPLGFLAIVILLGSPAAAGVAPGQGGSSAADVPPTVADSLGVNIHFIDPAPGEMEMLAASGLRWIRTDLAWASTETARGQYDFSVYDRLVAALDSSHIRAVFNLDYANPLYDQNLSPASDEGRRAFASWAAAAVTHFRGHGFRWEIYNEPNAFWQPRPNTEAYIKLALAASEAIAEADPDEKMIGPASAVVDPPFLEACFRAGLLNYWWAVSIHPYRQTDPETAANDLRDVRLLIRKYAPLGKRIPMLISEWGYSSLWAGTDENKQAALLARSWLTALANDVPLTIWYDWRDGSDPKDALTHFGLVAPPAPVAAGTKPNSPFRPKPAYDAARTLTQVLGDFQFNKRLVLQREGDYALLFTNGADIRLAVWTTQSPHSATIPASPGDFTGTGLTGEQLLPPRAGRHGLELTLTGEPQYLTPVHTNGLLALAAVWERLPLEIEVRAPAVLPLHFSIKNPSPKPQSFALVAGGTDFEAGKPVKIDPGAKADLMIRVAAAARSATPATIGIELQAGKLGDVAQMTSIVASNPLRVTVMPATERFLPVTIANLSDDPVRGSLRVFGNGLRFECKGGLSLGCSPKEIPVRMDTVKDSIIRVPLTSPPKPDYTVGLEITDNDGNHIYFSPTSAFRLLDDFMSGGLEARLSNYSLLSEGGAKPGSLDAHPPPQGPPLPGMSALRLVYDLTGPGAGLSLVSTSDSQIPGKPRALGLWLDGEGSGVLPYLRFVDSTGQVFQEGGGPLNWKGWRYVVVFMDAPRGKHSGGANDGFIHYPIRWQSLLTLQNPPGKELSGNVYLSGLVLTYGPTAEKR